MLLAIPTRVHDGAGQRVAPLANSLLITANVLLFFFGMQSPVGPGTHPTSIVLYGFSHAGMTHLMVNMWLLWVVGNPVNRRLGNGYYLLGYLGAIFCLGVLARVVVGSYLVGSSGAIFAVIAVLAMLLPAAKTEIGIAVVFPITLFVGLVVRPREWIQWLIRWETISLRAFWFLLLVPILQLWGLFWWSWNWTNLGHLLGFVAGIVFVLLLPKPISMGSANGFRVQAF